jgi:phosphomannomutase
MTTQEVFALLAMYLLDVRKERGPLVKTLTSTDMLFQIGEMYDVPVFEEPVGFKYVAPVMIREKALLGGEESGGYGFRGHIPERDGMLAACISSTIWSGRASLPRNCWQTSLKRSALIITTGWIYIRPARSNNRCWPRCPLRLPQKLEDESCKAGHQGWIPL